jgi:formylglycine-generating enzyme required for sulfatase activity
MPQGEGCVSGCPRGKTLVAGHCCFPGQDWGARGGQCIGKPRCADGAFFREPDCLALPKGDVVAVEGGTFTPAWSKAPVTVPGFFLGAREVTVAQFGECHRAGKCDAAQVLRTDWSEDEGYCNFGVTGREQHPINCVGADQAEAYCRWVGMRLPSEAEWEWAARGGETALLYPWGTAAPDAQGCWDGGSAPRHQEGLGTCAAGSFPPGPGRLVDLAGNVQEWTVSGIDPAKRVLRGGGFTSSRAKELTSAARRESSPRTHGPDTGFRCAGP